MTARFQHAADSLRVAGFACLETFLPAPVVQALRQTCQERVQAGAFQHAAVGRDAARRLEPTIRGDLTQWLDSSDPSLAPYFVAMDTLRQDLNRSLFLGLDGLEAHFAMYPPGAAYARHLDRFRSDDSRVLSSVLYLNPDWTPECGGALRAFHSDGERDYLPLAGRLVLFLSAEVEHEVRPATLTRYSIAGWFRQSARKSPA